jgi:hypothetical protein
MMKAVSSCDPYARLVRIQIASSYKTQSWLIAALLTFIARVSSSLVVSKVKTCAITFRMEVCMSSSVIGRGSSVSSWFCEEFARRRLMEVTSTSCWTEDRFGSCINLSSKAEVVVNYTWFKHNGAYYEV